MREILRWAPILCVAVLADCDGGLEPTATAPQPLFSKGGGPVVQRATGAGHFTVGGEWRTFSFTALKYADGTVDGEYQLFSRNTGARIHGDVVCLSVDGNLAWVGGVQEHGSEGFPPGVENGFRVADNGEGASGPRDEMSTMSMNEQPGFAQAYCNAKPSAPPILPIEAGNIQVQCNENNPPVGRPNTPPSQNDQCPKNPGPAVFINEIHYDNAGLDTNEFIEVAGPAGTNLTGYAIELYNGNGGARYDIAPLVGTIPNQQNGFGTVALPYPTNGIQNGPADGIALVYGTIVIQFLSYEGTVTAANGTAAGMTSTDVGVSEGGSDPVGMSIQLKGTGTTYGDFAWVGPADDSPGAVNTGQTFMAP
jgi:hypothetical protein